MRQTVTCAICNKPIEAGDRRFADVNRVMKAQRHVHVGCMAVTQPSAAVTSPIQRLSARLRCLFGRSVRFDSV
jgi:hypothetical protein